MTPQFQIHFPFDQTVAVIHPDEHDKRSALSNRRFQLLGIHQKAAIPHHCQDLAVGIGQFGRDRSWEGERHGRQPIGDQAGIGVICRVEPCHPHFDCARVSEHNIGVAQSGADIGYQPLWFHRKRCITCSFLPFLLEHRTDFLPDRRQAGFWSELLCQFVKRQRNIALNADSKRVVVIDFCRKCMNVDDLLIGRWVDLGWRELL